MSILLLAMLLLAAFLAFLTAAILLYTLFPPAEILPLPRKGNAQEMQCRFCSEMLLTQRP